MSKVFKSSCLHMSEFESMAVGVMFLMWTIHLNAWNHGWGLYDYT